ncbi:hypothetical protein ACSBR2_018159 [Camellia fascicularis]
MSVKLHQTEPPTHTSQTLFGLEWHGLLSLPFFPQNPNNLTHTSFHSPLLPPPHTLPKLPLHKPINPPQVPPQHHHHHHHHHHYFPLLQLHPPNPTPQSLLFLSPPLQLRLTTSFSISASSTKTHLPLSPFSSSLSSSSSMSSSRPLRTNSLLWSPSSIGAVTLLALGNGAPDVFASVAAVRGGHPRTGFGAILSAGTFVSALVVGFVAIYAAPFLVDPVPFVRDVLFYLTAALFLFYVYLSAEIFLWQAIGFVGFYMFFVGFVFWMDLGMDRGKRKGRVDVGGGFVGDVEVQKDLIALDYENEELLGKVEGGKPGFHFRQVVRQCGSCDCLVNIAIGLT